MRSRVVLVHRRRQIADMYLKGRTQTEIAGQLAVSQMTVSRDLAIVEAEWREASKIEFERSRLRELPGLQRVGQYNSRITSAGKLVTSVTRARPGGAAPTFIPMPGFFHRYGSMAAVARR